MIRGGEREAEEDAQTDNERKIRERKIRGKREAGPPLASMLR